MVFSTLILILGSADSSLLLGRGVFQGVNAKYLAPYFVIVGLGGQFGEPKVPGKNILNTYTLLLIKLEKNYKDFSILSKLELSNLKGERFDPESETVFELSQDRKFLFVKPSKSPDLHILEISRNSIKFLSRFDDKIKDKMASLISLVVSKFSNKVVITYLGFNKEKQKLESEVLVCSSEHGKLIIIKNLKLRDLNAPIWKGCLLGEDNIVLISPEMISLVNLNTEKFEEFAFKFKLKRNIRSPVYSFFKDDCWFQQDLENKMHVFVASPGNQLIQIEIENNKKIMFNEKNTLNVYGDTREFITKQYESNIILFSKKNKLKYIYGLRVNQKDWMFLTSDFIFESCDFSVFSGNGVVLTYRDKEVTLYFFQFKN